MKFSVWQTVAVATVIFTASACVDTQSAVAGNAKDFPTQPITIVLPYPPGGGSDSLVRLIAGQIAKELDTSV